jgi:hypothetical protein
VVVKCNSLSDDTWVSATASNLQHNKQLARYPLKTYVCEISGSSTVCYNNTSFGIAKQPASTTVSWSVSSALEFVGANTGASVLVKAKSNGTSGTVTATLSNSVVLTHAIQTCDVAINGSESLFPGVCSRDYWVNLSSLPPNGSHPIWSISNSTCPHSGLSNILGLNTTFSKAAAGVYEENSTCGATAELNFSFATFENGQYITHYCPPKTLYFSQGAPTLDGIYASSTATTPITTGMPGTSYALKANSASGITSYEWAYAKGGGTPTTLASTAPTAYVTFPSTGSYTVTLRGYDGCAWSYPVSTTFEVVNLYTIYPIPVTAILFATKNTLLPAPPLYCYAEIISIQNSNVEWSGTFAWSNSLSINVMSIPNGNYLLVLRVGGSGSSGQLVQTISFVKNDV